MTKERANHLLALTICSPSKFTPDPVYVAAAIQTTVGPQYILVSKYPIRSVEGEEGSSRFVSYGLVFEDKDRMVGITVYRNAPCNFIVHFEDGMYRMEPFRVRLNIEAYRIKEEK